MQTILQSEASASERRLLFECVSEADERVGLTGLTFAAGELKTSKAGAAEANHLGSVTELGGGTYAYEATAGEVDTLGVFQLRFGFPLKAGVRRGTTRVQVVALDPYSATVALSAAERNAVADALLDRTDAIETGGWTFRRALRIILSACGGKSSGHAAGAPKYRDVPDTKDRISATTDGDGNRTTVTLDGA